MTLGTSPEIPEVTLLAVHGCYLGSFPYPRPITTILGIGSQKYMFLRSGPNISSLKITHGDLRTTDLNQRNTDLRH